MNTFKHNRIHNGIVATALTVGALGLGLASPGAIAMTTEHDRDRDHDGFNDQIGLIIKDNPGAVVVENPDFDRRTAELETDVIGGKVGPLPRPGSK